MTEFTRRTYRAARKRSLREVQRVQDIIHPLPWNPNLRVAIEAARRIVTRGRREKGMWT